jgi:hypothetical protein
MTDPPPFPFGGAPPKGPDPESVAQAVATIAARDRLFNLDSFLAEAQQAFWLVGQAYARCKPELIAGVLSPPLVDRHRGAIEAACREQRVTAPADDDAESGRLVSIASDASHDTIVVHFSSHWRATEGKRGKDERHIENWCFQRPAAAETARAGAGERCGNCGALLSESVGGTCRYCGTPIGTGDGWRVIRVDEVPAPEAASAIETMQSIMGAMATAAAAANAAKATSAGGAAQQETRAATARSRRGRGCGGPVLLVVLVLAGLGVGAVGSTGSLHRAVAKVFPSIRHPRLRGPLDVSGTINTQRVVATQVVPKFQSGGTCLQAAQRSSWDFLAKLADGSTFHLEFGLPPGTGAPGTYKRPDLSLSATASNSSRYRSWSVTTASTALLTVQPGGGGDLQFANLALAEAGATPLSGHLTWSCALA